MKKTRIKALACALVLFTLAICGFALSTTSSAEESFVTTAKIGDANVSFDGELRLAFTVITTVLTPTDADLGIMVWDSSVTEPTLKNCSYVNLNEKSQNGTTYYLVRPTKLADITTEFYVAACYKIGTTYTIAEPPFKYSIEKFFTYNLASPITEDSAEVYQGYLELAEDAGATDITAAKTVGGYLGYNKVTFGGALGQDVILRADAKNGDGEYFLCWKDKNGGVVSYDRVTTVNLENEGISEFRAMYGDRELSKYKATYDFEALDDGLIEIAYPVEDNVGKVVSGYDSAKTPLFQGAKSLNGLKLTTYRSLKKIAENQYVYSTGHDYYIVDSVSGGKAMKITNGHQGRGVSASFSDIYEAYAVGAEVDMQYNTAKSGGFFHINLTLVDKNGKSVSLRTNITSTGSTCTFYCEGDGSAYPAFYLQRKPALKRGNVLSFRAELDRAGEAIDIYVNGTFLEKVSLKSYATYKKAIDAAEKKTEETGEAVTAFDLESLTISTIGVHGISTTKDDITIDNITFLCGEPIIKDENTEESAE